MSLEITLLGKPSVMRDGEPVAPPKGRKAWALLAYLLRTETTPTRERLASLLFTDAEDPLGALRWNLAEVRKLVGRDALDDVRLTPPPGTVVDVAVLTGGVWIDAVRLPGLGDELLAGMDFGASPAFDAWLLNERRHVRAASEAVLREAALANLGAGRSDAAIDHAARLVAMDPLIEEHQSLLVRCYAAAGDGAAAARQIAAARDLFLRELGIEPDTVIAAGGALMPGTATAPPALGASGARAMLRAGRAAVDAGVLDAGIECLRRAVAEAATSGDATLRGEALVALGSTLAHSGRAALKEEAAAILHEAIALDAAHEQTATAKIEFGWIDILAGRYARAVRWFADAQTDDPALEALRLLAVGICRSDVGRYAEAIDTLARAAETAQAHATPKLAARCLGFLGRSHLLRGEVTEARAALERSLALVEEHNLVTARPFPEAFLGEVRLVEDDLDGARATLEHAFALGCQIGDACYESPAARGLGFVAERAGDPGAALERLLDARERLVLRPDYLWMEMYALEGLSRYAARHRLPQAAGWISELEAIAARTGMREFLARAYIYRGELGDAEALEAARVLASEVDTPVLDALIDRAGTAARAG